MIETILVACCVAASIAALIGWITAIDHYNLARFWHQAYREVYDTYVVPVNECERERWQRKRQQYECADEADLRHGEYAAEEAAAKTDLAAITPPNAELLKLANKYPVPQEWYDEE